METISIQTSVLTQLQKKYCSKLIHLNMHITYPFIYTEHDCINRKQRGGYLHVENTESELQ